MPSGRSRPAAWLPGMGGGLWLAKQLLGRLTMAGVLFASGVVWEAPPVILCALIIGATSVPIWLRAYKAEKLGLRGLGAEFERIVEQRIADLEERQRQHMAELEDQQYQQMTDLEERLEFTERLLTKHQDPAHTPI